MPAVTFPKSSTPGLRPGEGEGRLINAYTEKAGDTFYIRRTPGLIGHVDTGRSGLRGMIEVSGAIYAAFAESVVKVANGAVTVLAGSLPGTDGVTFARNNRVTNGASTPDLVAVRESGGAYVVTATEVKAYPDADLPGTVNSVEFQDGFLLFTLPDGRMFASELNSTDMNALSFATAEAKPDGIVRGIVYGGTYYVMGSETIEPWKNVGASPFPLQRLTSVMPVGLLTTMAVAGFELGWDHDPYFVAHDGTVRAIRGYEAPKVSTPDVEAFIASSTPSTLEACVYTAKGNAFWSLSSDRGTWELNVTTGLWHERISGSLGRWRGVRSIKSGGHWVVGDRLSTALLIVSDDVKTEFGAPVLWQIESSPLADYPSRVAIPALFGHFTQADNVDIAVSWSLDGGTRWGTPLTRALATADKDAVRVNRLGLSTHHGLRVRFASSSAGDFSFMGASVPDPQVRAA